MPSTGERRRPWLRARLHPSLHPRLLGAALALLESSLEVLSVYIFFCSLRPPARWRSSARTRGPYVIDTLCINTFKRLGLSTRRATTHTVKYQRCQHYFARSLPQAPAPGATIDKWKVPAHVWPLPIRYFTPCA